VRWFQAHFQWTLWWAALGSPIVQGNSGCRDNSHSSLYFDRLPISFDTEVQSLPLDWLDLGQGNASLWKVKHKAIADNSWFWEDDLFKLSQSISRFPVNNIQSLWDVYWSFNTFLSKWTIKLFNRMERVWSASLRYEYFHRLDLFNILVVSLRQRWDSMESKLRPFPL